MIFNFSVSFEGRKDYHIEAEDREEARDKLAADLEWDVPNLQFYQVLLEEELEG